MFNETFSNTAIDTTKWNTAYRWGSGVVVNAEEQYYVDTLNNADFGYDPFLLDDGKLAITAIETPAELSSSANDQPYLSGVLTSSDKFDFTYGYAEMRAKVPSGDGLWPAFWMLPTDFVGRKPQIFAMEMNGSDPGVAYHSYKYQDDSDEAMSSGLLPTRAGDLSQDFHNYGVEWSQGSLVYYIDGVEYQRFDSAFVSDQAMYMIVNLAVGGWFVGSPAASTGFPASLEIDHIRVYQMPSN